MPQKTRAMTVCRRLGCCAAQAQVLAPCQAGVIHRCWWDDADQHEQTWYHRRTVGQLEVVLAWQLDCRSSAGPCVDAADESP